MSTNLIVVLVVTFHTNCFVHSTYQDGRREARCVVERVCSIDHDLGDGARLQLSVTNVVEEFNQVYKVTTKHHPILGAVEEKEGQKVQSLSTPPIPTPAIIFPLPGGNPGLTQTNLLYTR